MARPSGIKKKILRVLGQRGTVNSTHDKIMAVLKLSGCNHVEFDTALEELVSEKKVRVRKTATHITISLRG